MSGREPKAVVIGASAGALEALSVILPTLGEDFRLPLLIVVHIPPDKSSVLADLFRSKCRIGVREAEDKEPIEAGTAYFAPPDYHLLVETGGSHLALSSDEPVLYSRPSIDVLFESAADAFGAGVIGIVLTGANHDGAAGLAAIMSAGGWGIVQSPEGAFATAMPEAAIERCPDAQVLSLDDIAIHLKGVSAFR